VLWATPSMRHHISPMSTPITLQHACDSRRIIFYCFFVPLAARKRLEAEPFLADQIELMYEDQVRNRAQSGMQ
jgi:hypothetical protein